MLKIKSTRRYDRVLKKFAKKHPELRNKYLSTLSLLQKNPRHPSLRLHKLHGQLEDYYSISLNMKYRIVLDFIIRDDVVILIDIGTYDGVY
jgi:addiction module RelE/StbE family toxin